MGDILKKAPGVNLVDQTIRSGATGRSRDAKKAAAEQAQKEKLRLAEAESDVATRKAAATSGKAGRRSLIKSSPTGLATNLGGTTV